ncbi:MAG TPA: TetR/AcrR family transcriptional regulator [Solirubrobacteraceae bacterium]|jgi:AcrR family transcriptional regulator
MEVKRRTQAERTAATRAALVAAARPLFAARGYAAVGTPEIVRAAGVTRGAMYHQFADKAALFGAVAEAVEAGVTQRLVAAVGAAGAGDPLSALHVAIDAWFDACEEPEVRRVLLLDAPVVLGWEGLRDLAQQYGLGLTEQLLGAAIEAGQLPALPVRPFAHVLLGALQEAAFVVTDDPGARADAARVLHALVDGLSAASVDPGAERDV